MRGRAKTFASLFSSIDESSSSNRSGKIPILPNAPDFEMSFPKKSKNPRTCISRSPTFRAAPLRTPIAKPRPLRNSTITHASVTCICGTSIIFKKSSARSIARNDPPSTSAFCSRYSETLILVPFINFVSCAIAFSGDTCFNG